MKKKLLSLCVTVLLLAALLPLTVQTAFAQDYDRILSYQVDVTPNVNDGSLAIRLSFRWKALEDLPATNSQKGGAKIGIPNGSIRDMKALSDNIADIQNDNSYAYVDFTQGYKAGQEFDFSFSWVQEYMYTLNNGEVAYDYTPGWFDGILIDEMTLTWHDPAGVTGVASEGDTQNGDHILTASSMGYGDKLPLTVTYADWPTALDSQYSRENIPEDYNNGSYYEGDRSLGDTFATVIGFIIMIAIICFVVSVLTSIGRYVGGFGTRYVFVNGLWYPRGPGGRPRPGSVGTKTRPRPPRSSRKGGFGGGSRGGGFGGGGHGFGGFGGFSFFSSTRTRIISSPIWQISPKGITNSFSRPRNPQTQPGPGTMIARILPVHGSTSRSPTNPSRLQSQTLITSRLFNSLIRIASSPGSKHFMYPINHRPVIRAGCCQPVILSIYSLCSISCP